MSKSDEETISEKIFQLTESFRRQAQTHLDAVAELSKRASEAMAPLVELSEKVAMKLAELATQFKTAIKEGVNNFDAPEKYDSKAVQVHPWTEELALREGVNLLEKLEAGHFSYMFERYRKGLYAHIIGEFQLSIFTFLSLTDGILKEFCKTHKEDDCPYQSNYPTFDKVLEHFMNHYELEVFVEKGAFKQRLEAFFKHRHQIMHGDRYAHFDKNISTVALLFLSLVFSVVESESKSASK